MKNDDKKSPISDFDFDKVKDSIDVNALKELLPDLSNIDFAAVQRNVMAGEAGQRGETYVAGQFALLLCVALGSIPVVGSTVTAIVGPGLLLLGIVVILQGVTALGPALSPWITSSSDAQLQTTKETVYGYLRHPIYAGLLYLCVGLAIWTNSADRLVLSALLAVLLDRKSALEETDLVETFGPEYQTYMKSVPNKFVPQQVLDIIQQQ